MINSSNGLLYRVDDDGVATPVDLGGYVITNGDGLLREGRTLYAVQNRLNQVAVFKLDKSGASGELRDTLTSPTSTCRPRSRGPAATSTCRTRGSRRRRPRPRRTG